MVISNHFLRHDLVHHPIDSQPFINRFVLGSRLESTSVFFVTLFQPVKKKMLNGWNWCTMYNCEWNLYNIPSKIEWDLTNGPLTKLLELLDSKV